MGDYAKNNKGHEFKIGTCGNAYYATLEQLQNITNKCTEINYYLNPANKCQFAFPFPEYKHKEAGEISNFHEGQKVDFVIQLDAENQSWHENIYTHVHPKGCSGQNLISECPQKETPRRMPTNKNSFYLRSLSFDKEQNLVVGVECCYCQRVNILDEAELLSVMKSLETENELLSKESRYFTEEQRKTKIDYHSAIIDELNKVKNYNLGLKP